MYHEAVKLIENTGAYGKPGRITQIRERRYNGPIWSSLTDPERAYLRAQHERTKLHGQVRAELAKEVHAIVGPATRSPRGESRSSDPGTGPDADALASKHAWGEVEHLESPLLKAMIEARSASGWLGDDVETLLQERIPHPYARVGALALARYSRLREPDFRPVLEAADIWYDDGDAVKAQLFKDGVLLERNDGILYYQADPNAMAYLEQHPVYTPPNL